MRPTVYSNEELEKVKKQELTSTLPAGYFVCVCMCVQLYNSASSELTQVDKALCVCVCLFVSGMYMGVPTC